MKLRLKKVLSVFIGIMMLMQLFLPITAFAEETSFVCYIGTSGYVTLAKAVSAATAGDTIWMTANDSGTNYVTIDKDLIIELDGYTLSYAAIKFSGNINVKLNDRVGTAKLNTNKKSGFSITDYTSDSRLRAPFYLTGGANVTISGTTGGTEIYGGGMCSNGYNLLEKAVVVGPGCHLTVNGGSLVYSGYTGTDGVFVCDTGVLTLNDVLISRYSKSTGGSSISYAQVPTTENPLTIKKGLFYGGMWVEATATINGVTISRGRLSFTEIEQALLYTSEGSYIDYDRSTSSNGWEIYIASSNLSTDTDIDNAVDTTEALRVSAGGNIKADEGQKVIFNPQVTGGDGESEITYSWSFNGEDMDITTANYTIEAAAISDAGTYVITAVQGASSVSCTYQLIINSESGYTVTAVADDGGSVSGGGEVAPGDSVTLTATANDGYTFDGWYEGDTKVCDTAEFVVKNVTADKTYTAKFAENQDPEPVEPLDFDFTSLRTLRTQDITVNHETKTIDIDAEADTDYITVFVHQLDTIPGGTFKMASYMGNKVVYDSAGSYRIYFLSSPTVSVLANITVGEQTEQYTVNVNFDLSRTVFDFTSLRGENMADIAVDHETNTIDVQATDDAETIILYVSQHNAIYGGTLRMASYLGNKVTYATNGVYTVYSSGKENVSVKTNITINGVTEQYRINIIFPSAAPDFSFGTLAGDGIKSVAVDHEAGTIVLDAVDDATSITLPIDQSGVIANGTLRMASYMGNKVVLDTNTRVYTVSMRDAASINVKVNITISGETREYLVTVNFPEVAWGFDTVKAEQVKSVTVDHEQQVINMDVEEGYDNILLYINQTVNAELPGQIWMKSYNGNDVVYHSADKTYTITKKDQDTVTVAVKITMLGETRYYDLNIHFASSEQ